MEGRYTMEEVKVVIVDANILIKGAGQGGGGGWLPQDLRQGARDGTIKVMTIPQVMIEVKDKAAREALATTLLFDIDVKDPTEEAIQKVKKFARQTGDLLVLSEIDIQLIALAYDIERESHGLQHILEVPKPLTHIVHSASSKAVKMPGWDPKDDSEWGVEESQDNSQSKILFSTLDKESVLQPVEGETSSVETSSQTSYASPDVSVANGVNVSSQVVLEEDEVDGEWEVARKSKNAQRKHRLKKLRQKEEIEMEESEEISEDIPILEKQDLEDDPKDHFQSSILSLTGDNAMQNVLLQMGFRVLGPRGQVINELRKWALKCHACGYDTNRNLDSIFCPKCGNMNTLRKCQVVVSRDGVSHIQQRANQSLRGTKFSLPLPKGGRHDNPPLLREDMMKKQRNKSKGGPNAFAPEYNEETWFQVTQVNRKGNMMPHVHGQKVVTNPNERRLTRTNRRR